MAQHSGSKKDAQAALLTLTPSRGPVRFRVSCIQLELGGPTLECKALLGRPERTSARQSACPRHPHTTSGEARSHRSREASAITLKSLWPHLPGLKENQRFACGLSL